ncbi:MAG: hypothetical protein ACI4N3_00105 [Alphaproteobacteria bacterium]
MSYEVARMANGINNNVPKLFLTFLLNYAIVKFTNGLSLSIIYEPNNINKTTIIPNK